MARVKISEFGVIQKLLAGATVQILSANDSGESTGVLATLYEASTGSGVVSNPQTLNEDGKLSIDCYVDGIVVAEISNISDLAERTIKKLRANPTQFPLGATNAAFEGANVAGFVDDAEAAATQAGAYLGLIEDTFQGIPSTSSLSISSGSKTFTVAAGLPFGVGQYIIATSNANPTTHSMNGQVTAYSGTSLTITVDAFLGSGSRADWTIRSSGPRGATGATGPAGDGSGDMLKSENLSGLANYATARSNLGLGTAAQSSSSSFATAAQGAKADTALQPADNTVVYLGQQVASASAQLDFTGLTSATYNTYFFEADDLVFSVDGADLYFRTSTDNGLSFDSGAGNYQYSGNRNASGSTATTALVSTGDTKIPLALSTGNAIGESLNCTLKLYNPLGASTHRHGEFKTGYTASTGELFSIQASFKRSANAIINAFRFYPSSGNIASGTIRMYGIRKS